LEASKELLQTKDATVADTALAVGFATPQSFARAFRRHTGMTPTEHRASSPPTSAASDKELKVEIERRGEILVVALRREGKAYTDLNATFGQVWSWAEATDVLKRLEGIYGIPLVRLELMTYFRFGDGLIVEDNTIFDTQGRPCES
jgi:AraC family transcriptional regulator